MATVFTHAVLGIAAAKTTAGRTANGRFLLLSAACAVLPDLDTLGMHAGIPYGHFLGHRGFFHSPFFALAVSTVVVVVFFRKTQLFGGRRLLLAGYFFAVTAGHGLIDAMTNGGLGIAFLSPFSNERYFLPWRPIQASPFGMDIFSPIGYHALADELGWLLLPALLIWLTSYVVRNAIIREE